MNNTSCILAVSLFIITIGHVNAQSIDEWDHISPNVHSANSHNHLSGAGAVPDISETLFVGTSSNINNAAGTANDVFAVEINNTSQSILTANGVWGATADAFNQRILFTQASELEPPEGLIGGGDNLFELPYAGGTPQLLGRITMAGAGLRVDGLAMRKGVLYGVNAGNSDANGFYEISLKTLEATLIAQFPDNINGLDADPESCIIYGTNDTTGQVVRLDTSGNIENLVAYPVGLDDIDGIAVG